jgi:UDP-GlcNAc:undecaprenyl-phosphate GlcNAc-1-phosphate transferase
VDALLTIFWIIGIANALNLLDNMDGLCAGIAAIAGIACWGDLAAGAVWPAHYAAALTGACLAFLFFNFNPASIFMGDSGSLFLGASLAVLAGSGAPDARADVLSSMAVPVLLLLIPIFDTTFVTVARILSRRSAASGGRDHTSHRLVAMGFSEREAVVILWLLGAAGGAVAVLAPYWTEATFIGPLLLVGLILLGVQLARVRVYGGEDFSALRGRRYTPLLVEFTYRRRVFELLLDVVLVALCYYAAYAIRFDRDMPLYGDLLLESLPIVIGCQIISFTIVGVYRGTWRYISVADLGAFAKGVGLGTVGSVMVLLYLYRFEGYSRGVFLIYAMTLGVCVVGARLSERLLADLAGRHRQAGRRAIVYGAGDGAALLLRELRNNALFDFVPVALIDDDPSKHRKMISRVPVIGGFEALRGAIVTIQPEVVIVSTSSISASRRRAIAETCYESGTALLEFRVALRPVELPRAAEERAPDRTRPIE